MLKSRGENSVQSQNQHFFSKLYFSKVTPVRMILHNTVEKERERETEKEHLEDDYC